MCTILFFSFALPSFATDDGIIELSDDSIFLYVSDVKNLSAVKNYSGVKELLIENSHITADAEILGNKTAEDVSFFNCTFDEDFTIPPKTKILKFKGNIPESMSKPANLKSIEKILIEEAELKDLAIFSSLKNLKEIQFSFCNIKSIAGIEKMKSLETVSFDAVGIESVRELKQLKNLKSLSLLSTQVESIAPIKNLKLEYLDVSDSLRIKDLDVVTNIKTLECFYANNCQMMLTQKIIDFLKEHKIDTDITDEDLQTQKQVRDIARKLFNKAMSTEEKIGRAVKYVCDLITYDTESLSDSEVTLKYNKKSLEYALEGAGNCMCYTILTAVLLQLADIECYQVYNIDHVWNLIEIDGYFYWLDVTWIDSADWETIGESPYFMAGNSFLERHRDFAGQPYSANDEKLFSKPYEQTMVFNLSEPLEEIIPDEEITEDGNNNKNPVIIYVVVAVLVVCGAVVTVVFIKRKKD